MSRYFKLPSGMVFDSNEILIIARQDLNEYAMLLKNCPIPFKVSGADLELIENAIPGLTKLETPPKILQ